MPIKYDPATAHHCNDNNIILEQFENDKFAKLLGAKVLELDENTIRMEMTLRDELNNLFAKPHGGVIYSFADIAFSILSNNRNNISVAIDCSISYHNAPLPGEKLYLLGETISISRKLSTHLFHVYAMREDEQGNNMKIKIATMKGTAYRTGKPIKPGPSVKSQK
ncbi:MAG: PaaI family thioesterase [Promethearchaeota archaeon]